MLSIDQVNNLEAENKKLNIDLKAAVIQYKAVVKQNKDLQGDLNKYKNIFEKTKIMISDILQNDALSIPEAHKAKTICKELKVILDEVIPA